MKTFICLMLLSLSAPLFANTTTTKTCSGRMNYCDQYGICTSEHFYLYAYQSVTLNQDGTFRRHRYRLRTRSILGNPEDYIPRQNVQGEYVIYDGPNFSLAIPWVGGLPLYYFQPNFGVDEWQELCL